VHKQVRKLQQGGKGEEHRSTANPAINLHTSYLQFARFIRMAGGSFFFFFVTLEGGLQVFA
jgi:hypothetical protein